MGKKENPSQPSNWGHLLKFFVVESDGESAKNEVFLLLWSRKCQSISSIWGFVGHTASVERILQNERVSGGCLWMSEGCVE